MRLGRIATLSMLLLLTAAGSAQERLPFTLAVVRQDGILIPFATYHGSWRNGWPVPRPSAVVPISLDNVPKEWWPLGRAQQEWRLWRSDGDHQPIRALAPAWFRAQCQSNVGLKTDFQATGVLAPPDAAPYPKAGLATSVVPGAEPWIEPIAVLDEESPDWKRVLAALPAAFEQAEAEAFSSQGGRRYPGARERAQRPIRLEALYRTPDTEPGGFILYLEAVRRYEEPPKGRSTSEPPCDLIAYAWGWVRQRPGGTNQITLSAVLTDCYRWNVAFVLPLGAMRTQGGRPLWVLQSSGWLGESYIVTELVEPAMPNILWQTPGGGCR